MTTTSQQSITPELRQWIIDQARAGHRPEAVLEAMKSSGWREDVALDAMETVLGGLLKQHVERPVLPPPHRRRRGVQRRRRCGRTIATCAW